MSLFADHSPPLREAKAGSGSMDYGGAMLASVLSSLPNPFYIAQDHLPKVDPPTVGWVLSHQSIITTAPHKYIVWAVPQLMLFLSG